MSDPQFDETLKMPRPPSDVHGADTVATRLAQLGAQVEVQLSGPPPTPADLRGRAPRLGRHRVLDVIGAGGMGTVLMLEDADLGRRLAAKVLDQRSSGSRDGLRRFLLEAKVSGQLEHPNIIPIHELGISADDELFFTMKRVSGTDLSDELKRVGARVAARGATDPSAYLAAVHRLLGMFLKVCDAMEFAHSRGVIHRDLKPANIMVGEFGEVLVMDWGLAKVMGDAATADISSTSLVPDLPAGEIDETRQLKTQAGTVLGTPNYMAPEQARGEIASLDHRADIYSLGAILFHMLTFQPMYHESSPWQVIVAVASGRRSAPSTVRPDLPIPFEIEAITLKATEAAAGDRYASVAQLRRDVEDFLVDGWVGAADYNPRQQLAKLYRRHRTQVLGAAVALGAIAVVAGLAFTQVVRALGRETRALERQSQLRADAETQRDRAMRASAAESAARQAAERARAEAMAASAEEKRARMAADTAREAAVAARGEERKARTAAEAAMASAEASEKKATAALASARVALQNALVFRANLALERRRLLDAAVYLAAAAERGPSARVEAAMLGLPAAPVALARTIAAHDQEIAAIAFAPDGKTLASGGDGGVVRIWDAATGARRHQLDRDLQAVTSLSWSPDGARLAIGRADGEVALWRPGGAARVLIAGDDDDELEPWTVVRWSPGGAELALSRGDGVIRLVDARGTTRRTLEGHEASIAALGYSGDGAQLASLDEEGALRIWQVATGAEVALPDAIAEDHVTAIAFVGRRLVVHGDSGTGLLEPGKARERALPQAMIPARPFGMEVVVHAGRRLLVAGGMDEPTRLVDLDRGALLCALTGQRGAASALAVRGGGFATADRDGVIRIWRLAGARPIVLADSRDVRDAEAPPVQGALAGGRVAWLDDRWLGLYSATSGARLARSELKEEGREVWLSPDGRSVALTGYERGLRLYRRTGRALARRGRLGRSVEAVAWAPDSARLYAGESDGTVIAAERDPRRKVWQVAVGDSVEGLAVSADGKTLAASSAGRVRLLDAATGQVRRVLPEAGLRPLVRLAFSPDGTYLAAGDLGGSVWLWSLAKPGRPQRLTGHLMSVHQLVWSPDSRLLVSAAIEGTLAVWRPGDHHLLRLARGGHPVAVAFGKDGRTLTTVDRDGAVVVTGRTRVGLKDAMRASGLRLDGVELCPLTPAELGALKAK